MWSGYGGYDSAYGGGGGYTQSPGGFASPSATQSEKDSRSRSQNIVPCTVSQLLSAEQVDEVFRVREVELSQVRNLPPLPPGEYGLISLSIWCEIKGSICFYLKVVIVGIIRQAEKAPTNILYKVDDMTAGPMDVRQWIDTDEEGRENIVVPPGTYVKVAGHLRSFQILNLIKSCATTEDKNVLSLKKGSKVEHKRQLYYVANKYFLFSFLPSRKAVEFLSSEGHIYSTIDDEHFKSTDAD
ncbi:hypothetical protein JD844_005571 [Phrynosoma platyrhinos]|uniref:Replication protein A C-terminal domain-containing protein n=1 Tax=Phrynosoma platyrhinos TaxID=52577 RepID=A0ABQ7TNC7_PHRPL|nr:hypothetical protein JD844_005571 [Phrynosoma platyrhinos]